MNETFARLADDMTRRQIEQDRMFGPFALKLTKMVETINTDLANVGSKERFFLHDENNMLHLGRKSEQSLFTRLFNGSPKVTHNIFYAVDNGKFYITPSRVHGPDDGACPKEWLTNVLVAKNGSSEDVLLAAEKAMTFMIGKNERDRVIAQRHIRAGSGPEFNSL